MKKVISFSLWGERKKYTVGLLKNVLLTEQVYRGWDCYIYYDNTVPGDCIRELVKYRHVELINMEGSPIPKIMWRIIAIDNSDVEIMIVRDADSRLSEREKSAVDQWLRTNKKYHIMRDHHIFHDIPMLGGMWGMKKDNYVMKDLILVWCGKLDSIPLFDNDFNPSNKSFGFDQQFLREVIYPKALLSCVCHDDFYNYPSNVSYPKKRTSNKDFVGAIYNENDIYDYDRNGLVPTSLGQKLTWKFRLQILPQIKRRVPKTLKRYWRQLLRFH